ncbi:MAG: response regulator [Gemmatimonadota bacterium]|nr:response regulator [Gemmatimonadota bacterium]
MTSPSVESSGNAEAPKAFRVLVVDDDATVCAMIVTFLNSRGHEAVGAVSGAEALKHLESEYFDVLLCDVRMPGMSGLDLLTSALDIVPGIPVLMLSGASDVGTARDALHRGAMDFLVKPVALDELDRSVGAAARRRRTLTASENAAMENVELHGGPLDKRRVRIEDSRFRLWVVNQVDGRHVWAAIETPTTLDHGSTLLGAYAYSTADNAMHWEPANG